MKKQKWIIIFAVIVCMFMTVPAYALESQLTRVVDDADLLTDKEEASLVKKVDEISDRQEFDVVIVTVNSLEGKTPQQFADDFYDYSAYGYGDDKDGALLLVSMEDNDWYISTKGFGITAITDAGREYMADQFKPYLSDKEYKTAFETYSDWCDDFVTQAKEGKAYDTGNLPRGPYPFARNILISLALGLIAGFVGVQCMKAKLKTVKIQKSAANYEKSGSLVVNDSREMFLYAKVDRREIPKENESSGSDTHTSSSGETHGGGGGKF